MTKLILASASAARIALLRGAGLDFESRAAEIDEGHIRDRARANGLKPNALAIELAAAKAETVSVKFPGNLVIGGDQILVCNDTLFSKPRDLVEAADQLRSLRGRSHSLFSAATLVRDGTVLWSCVQSVRMTMRDFSEAFLDDYLQRTGPAILDSVGAYHLEGLGAQLFSGVEGDYFTVLGLPLLAVLDALRDQGVLLD